MFDTALSAISVMDERIKEEENLNLLICNELTFIVEKKLRGCEEGSDILLGVKLFRTVHLLVTRLNHGSALVLYTLNFFKIKKNYNIFSYMSLALLSQIVLEPTSL